MKENNKANKECVSGRKFRHVNGKTYVVHSGDGCFYNGSQQIFGKFGGQTLRDGKPFGPMRDMKISNVAEWL